MLIVLGAVGGVTAAEGGIAVAAGLEGEWYPAEWLKGTPFSRYLIPGLILAVAVGGSGRGCRADSHGARDRGVGSMLAGVILMRQLAGGIRLLRQPITWIEVAYSAAGSTMVALG